MNTQLPLPDTRHEREKANVNGVQQSEITYHSVTQAIYIYPFNGLLSRTTRVSRYQKGNTNLDFIGARDSDWQWHQLGHMQVCTSLQADNHASTPPLRFLQAGCPSCHPTNSVKALKAKALKACLCLYITHEYTVTITRHMAQDRESKSKRSTAV